MAAFSVVRDSYGPKKSGQMISYLNGAICFIPALAPLLGGWLTARAGWSANFWFMAGYALLVGSWLLWRMPETRPEETSSSGPLISWSRYSPVLRSPSFLFNAALCMLAMAVILAYVTAAPVQLMVTLGLDMNGFSHWFTANAALNILACFLAPRFIARVGRDGPLRIGPLVLLFSAISPDAGHAHPASAGHDGPGVPLQHRLCHDTRVPQPAWRWPLRSLCGYGGGPARPVPDERLRRPGGGSPDGCCRIPEPVGPAHVAAAAPC